MKKIVSSLIAGLMAVSLVMMGCSNDSSSDNSALMLLAGGGAGSGSGGASGTVAAGGAVKALADAKAGDTVDLSTYKFSDKIALTVDKAITVKNANLKGGYITLSEAATLDNVDGGTIVLVGDGKNATLKDCDAKNVIIKESELSRRAYGFTLKIIGGVVENIVNSDWYLTIETTKTTVKKLITNKSLVINSTDDSKIELIAAEKEITLAGKLVIEKAVSEKIVKVASNAVSIKKGTVEIEADDSELAEGGLDIEAIKAAVGELTESEGAAILSTVEALQSEVAEIGAKIEAAEEETKKALEEYEKEQAEKAVVKVYVISGDKIEDAGNVPVAELNKFIEEMSKGMPDGVEVKIELFADRNCTVKYEGITSIAAGDSVYIKVTANIPEGPIVPELPNVIIGNEKVPLGELLEDLENGQSFFINGEVNPTDASAWLPMTKNVFIFTYMETMNAWDSAKGSVKVNMTRNPEATDPYADDVKVSVWDKSDNISWAGGAISLDGLVEGKSYALVMTTSKNNANTAGEGKHVDLYEVAMENLGDTVNVVTVLYGYETEPTKVPLNQIEFEEIEFYADKEGNVKVNIADLKADDIIYSIPPVEAELYALVYEGKLVGILGVQYESVVGSNGGSVSNENDHVVILNQQGYAAYMELMASVGGGTAQ